MVFAWKGSLNAGQTYQVTAHLQGTDFALQSGLLTTTSWQVDIPAERFGEVGPLAMVRALDGLGDTGWTGSSHLGRRDVLVQSTFGRWWWWRWRRQEYACTAVDGDVLDLWHDGEK